MKYKTVARHAALGAVAVATHAGYVGRVDTATAEAFVALLILVVLFEALGHFLDD